MAPFPHNALVGLVVGVTFALAVQTSAGVGMQGQLLPTCVVYGTESNHIAFGALNSTGRIAELVQLPNWGGVVGGNIFNTADEHTFVLAPGDVKEPNHMAGIYATVNWTKPTKATLAVVDLNTVPGEDDPATVADLAYDAEEARSLALLTSDPSQPGYWLALAELEPFSGTISGLNDITPTAQAWAYVKTGVSAYLPASAATPGSGVAYFAIVAGAAGVNKSEAIVVVPVKPSAGQGFDIIPVPPSFDLLALAYSPALKAMVALARDFEASSPVPGEGLSWVSFTGTAAAGTWKRLYTYPASGGLTYIGLGFVDLAPDGLTAVAALQVADSGASLVSYVHFGTVPATPLGGIPVPRATPLGDIVLCSPPPASAAA